MKIVRSEALIIISLIVLGIIFRWNLIRDNHFLFYFDQARDAYISRSIIEQKDLKIQGPSASGTNDTLYHGALYYYLIAPIYTLSGGNPATVTIFLALINSLTILPIYLLAKEVFKNKSVGLLASLLYVVSVDAAQIGSWLSNPALVVLTITWFYLYAWKVFFKDERKYLPWLGLTLGLTHQLVIWAGYLFLTVVIFYWLTAKKKGKLLLFSPKQLITSSVVYLLTISSMVLTQIKLYLAGIFTLETIRYQLQSNAEQAAKLIEMINQYVEKISFSLLPTLPVVSLSIFSMLLIWFLAKKQEKNSKIFLMIWFLSPFFLAFRNSYHVLIGILPVIYIFAALSLIKLLRPAGKLTWLAVLALFTWSNLLAVGQIRAQQFNHVANIQQGAYLNQQLALIDKTYDIASGQHFAISTLTNPYKYNTTWAYLYDWYGKKKYGYVPRWIGSSQTGIPGGELLEKTDEPKKLLFAIYEPDPGGLYVFKEEFQKNQTEIMGAVVTRYEFGTLMLEERRDQ